jgi:hypothetical protein
MSLLLAIVHENARSALECGGSTPPWSKAREELKGGVEPPHPAGRDTFGAIKQWAIFRAAAHVR